MKGFYIYYMNQFYRRRTLQFGSFVQLLVISVAEEMIHLKFVQSWSLNFNNDEKFKVITFGTTFPAGKPYKY